MGGVMKASLIYYRQRPASLPSMHRPLADARHCGEAATGRAEFAYSCVVLSPWVAYWDMLETGKAACLPHGFRVDVAGVFAQAPLCAYTRAGHSWSRLAYCSLACARCGGRE